jgi:hypothetical protein
MKSAQIPSEPISAAASTASTTIGGVLDGPWLSAFWVLVPMQLRSKSNFRRGRTSEWRSHRSFEEEVAVELRRFLPQSWLTERPEDPLNRRPRYASVIAARSAVDAGNFSKSILDAAEGVVFTNDAQVQVTTALSERGRRDPYLLMAFAQLTPGCEPGEGAKAASVLLENCVRLLSEQTTGL